MTKKVDTVNIRIDISAKAVLDMVAAEMGILSGVRVTHSDVIMALVSQSHPHIRARLDELTSKKRENETNAKTK